MSSIIKISRSNSSAGIKLHNIQDSGNVDTETQDEFWKKQMELERQKYYEEGKKAAQTELENIYSQNLLAKFGEFEDLAKALNDKLVEYEQSFEKIVTELSYIIASKIVKKQLEVEPIIKDTVLESAQKLIGAESILIKVNPSDFELLKDSGRDLFRKDSFSKIQFEPDNNIDKGGCFIESEIGNVDARLKTQLNEIEKLLSANYYKN
jgi:flagellar assembly protein FliH